MLFFRINEIVAVGPDTFYTTNHHYYRPGVMSKIEVFLAELRWSYLIYYNNGTFSVTLLLLM